MSFKLICTAKYLQTAFACSSILSDSALTKASVFSKISDSVNSYYKVMDCRELTVVFYAIYFKDKLAVFINMSILCFSCPLISGCLLRTH